MGQGQQSQSLSSTERPSQNKHPCPGRELSCESIKVVGSVPAQGTYKGQSKN